MTLCISLQVIFWNPKIQKGYLVWKGTNHLTFVLTDDDEERCFESYTGDIPAPAH